MAPASAALRLPEPFRASWAQFSRLLKVESLAPSLADLRCLCQYLDISSQDAMIKRGVGELQRLEMGQGLLFIPLWWLYNSWCPAEVWGYLFLFPNSQFTADSGGRTFVHLSLLCGEAEWSALSLYEKSEAQGQT